MADFLNALPGDLITRFWPRFVQLGVKDLHSLSKLSQQQLRQVVPPLGPFRHLYAELQKDWHCEKCGFVNYARYGNAECYRCSSDRTKSRGAVGTTTHHTTDEESARISQMLHEREQTRRAQNFERADAIREELRMMGVVWDDDMKTWRAPDGRCGRWGTPSHVAAAAGAAQGGYCIKLRGLPFRVRYDDIRNFFAHSGIEILQYSVVLEKNADGRPSGVGYVKVATLQEQQQACSQLNHKRIPGYDRYAWVVEATETEYQQANNSWAGAILHDSSLDGDALIVSQKLKEREECRKNRNYDMADGIRDALREEGVTFDDELRTWTDKKGNSGRWGAKTPSYSSSMGLCGGMPSNGSMSDYIKEPSSQGGIVTPLLAFGEDSDTDASWPSSLQDGHHEQHTPLMDAPLHPGMGFSGPGPIGFPHPHMGAPYGARTPPLEAHFGAEAGMHKAMPPRRASPLEGQMEGMKQPRDKRSSPLLNLMRSFGPIGGGEAPAHHPPHPPHPRMPPVGRAHSAAPAPPRAHAATPQDALLAARQSSAPLLHLPPQPKAPKEEDELDDFGNGMLDNHLASILSVCNDQADDSFGGVKDAPLVSRLQSILCAVADSPSSP
eukprot:TRINITY_DN7291_c0_g2_i1.p1 TRINITY_DN7291_c0_g2~~TRINITY_DN7291_c0_g2_i1.p1  ORF type:complete len:636 (+),score=257.73 TRINITY_DN7291_c0_g2_i1:83-1909(+)